MQFRNISVSRETETLISFANEVFRRMLVEEMELTDTGFIRSLVTLYEQTLKNHVSPLARIRFGSSGLLLKDMACHIVHGEKDQQKVFH
jgi:hypothetical protein